MTQFLKKLFAPFSFLLLLLVANTASAQDDPKIDSLLNEIEATTDVQEKVDLLNELGEVYSLIAHDSLYSTAEQMILLADEIGDKCSKATAYFYRGNYFADNGEIDGAIENYFKCLEIRKSNCELARIASVLQMIGNMYGHKGDYDHAYSYSYQALAIYESEGDFSSAAHVYLNIGVLDSEREAYESALENIDKAHKMELRNEVIDSVMLGNVYNNYGTVYEAQENYDTAIFYFQKAMHLYELTNHKSGLSHGYNNIGICYYFTGFADSTMTYFKRSLAIRQAIGDQRAVSQSYNNISILHYYGENYPTAITYADSSLQLALNGGFKEEISDALLNKHDIYFDWGEYYEASINMKLYADYKDSIRAEQSERTIALMETKYETVKKEKELEEKNQALELSEASSKRKNLILYGGAIILLLLAAFARSIYLRNKVTKQQNEIIAEQKVIVEEKQSEILDSIRYAKRIQEALLKSEEHESQHLPEHFVLFKPKDIVSGDFYWVHEKEEHLYLAVADCTGHGVPGGFLTMLGASFLNEIVSKDEELTPAFILDELRDRIVKELSQTGEIGENRDGMDISLVRLNINTLEMHWAGANNPLWIVKEEGKSKPEEKEGLFVYEDLIEYRPDKQPIGHHWVMKPFTNHVLQLEKGDTFYLFSDGYADQFGGEKGKKFKYKNKKDLLLAIRQMSMSEKKSHLEEFFKKWMGEYEQIDDVCMVSVRV